MGTEKVRRSAVNDIVYWVWLSLAFGVDNSKLHDAVEKFGDAETAYRELANARYGEFFSRKLKANSASVLLDKAHQIVDKCRAKGIGIMSCEDEHYPSQLNHLNCPPAVLYYQGNISCLSESKMVTAVGAREPSEYGVSAAYKICRQLAVEDHVIVSGFAVGTDITAHMAAADCGRPTVCVLGCGLDVEYPKSNMKFKNKILKSGGIFISEYPPGTSAFSGNFPKRNRILAVLSDVTIVFEASLRSGSLITARLVCEYGRELLVLPPGDIFSNTFSGNIELLRHGALPIYSAGDIINGYYTGRSLKRTIDDMGGLPDIRKNLDSDLKKAQEIVSVYEENNGDKTDLHVDDKKETKLRKKPVSDMRSAAKKKKIGTEISVPAVQKKTEAEITAELSGLSEVQRMICKAFDGEKRQIEELSQSTGVSAIELVTELTELEISGIVRQLPGKIYELQF